MEHQHHDNAGHTAERSLNRTALSATVHCLTGCAIGEVLGMVVGVALQLGNWTTVVLSVVLAFFFGYSLTMLPLFRAGLGLKTAGALAFASDTASIALMEVVDNLIMLVIPGAMDAGLSSLLFWGSLVASLVVAGLAAFPLNRWLIERGAGHAVLHRYH
jgi:hypothetical protein